MNIQEKFLSSSRNRPALRDAQKYGLRALRGIVIHWTANTDQGAGALANRNYFNSTKNNASAHFIVENEIVIQCLQTNEVAWHVGDKVRSKNLPRRKELMQGLKGRHSPNYYTIGIEMCVNEGTDFGKTLKTTAALCRKLLQQHNLQIKDIYRHYDITGKDCPKMLLPIKIGKKEYDWNWQAFLSEVEKPHIEIKEKTIIKEKIIQLEAISFPINTLIAAIFKKIKQSWQKKQK
jgi:N-acetylmuramoyl-L-alanine amidase CwlA